jgi:hypothetical protein
MNSFIPAKEGKKNSTQAHQIHAGKFEEEKEEFHE